MAPVASRELRPRKKTAATAKGSRGVSTTATRRNKGGGISTTTTRNKRGREQGKTTTRVAQASDIQPASDRDNYVESGSDSSSGYVESDDESDYVRVEVSKVTALANAKVAVDEVKEVTQKAFKGLETFLRRKGMSRDGPYKDAMQKLKKGEKVDDKVAARIANYIYQLLRGFRVFVYTLCHLEDWDDEVIGELIKFIKTEVHPHLEVEVKELQELLKVAEGACSESDETWKSLKCNRVRNRVFNWVINTRKLEDTLRDWGKKPTPVISAFDEGYTDYDEIFPTGHGLFRR